jgi:hypothetical protein
MSRALASMAVLVVIAVVAALGFRQGERRWARESGVATAAATFAPPAAVAASRGVQPHASARRALPDDLATLDGTEFIAAMPELERRAREGDQAAALLLIHRLQECTFRTVQDVDEIRRKVDEEYAHQLDIQKRWPGDKALVIDEAWHADRLKQELDFRDRCLALTPQALGRRLDVAELALARHERDVVIDLVRGSLFAYDAERVRYVDRLSAIADAERAEIGRLVEAGDRQAMEAAAMAYARRNFGVLEPNRPLAYAIAYALALAGGLEQTRIDWLLHEAGEDLSPDEIEAARTDGKALYARCCAGRGAGASR